VTLELQDIDHIHVTVADRAAAEVWYRDVLGLERSPELAVWAADGGPLTLQNRTGTVHLALFERPAAASRAVVAFRVSGPAYPVWKAHLHRALDGAVREEDHQLSRSLYLADPDGNPFEITTYELAEASVAGRAAAASEPPAVVAVRPGKEVMTLQRLPYAVGLSGTTVGSRGLSMHLVVIPPGARAEPHVHVGHETGIYVLSGHVLTRWGERLQHETVSGPGEFLFVPPGVPHEAVNLSATEPARAVIARNDPADQDRVVPYRQTPRS
jgi:uncharacterized RmlC-like cupin family protein/catechol 2,3-dioxygenase-like lactoylglutathione lyase family enzyme